MAETSYLSEFDGATTDDILTYAKNGKAGQVNEKVASYEQSGVKGYVDQMKGQTTVSDADTVQVFDTNGVPHKIAKTELLKKSAQALPTISDISAFIALNKAGNAIGLMSIEETAKVVGGLIGTVTSSKNGLVDRYTDMYCRDDIPQDLNDTFAGFGRADNRTNAPASYGIVISFYTRTKGNYICAQFYFSNAGTIYGRMKWEDWSSWKQLT